MQFVADKLKTVSLSMSNRINIWVEVIFLFFFCWMNTTLTCALVSDLLAVEIVATIQFQLSHTQRCHSNGFKCAIARARAIVHLINVNRERQKKTLKLKRIKRLRTRQQKSTRIQTMKLNLRPETKKHFHLAFVVFCFCVCWNLAFLFAQWLIIIIISCDDEIKIISSKMAESPFPLFIPSKLFRFETKERKRTEYRSKTNVAMKRRSDKLLIGKFNESKLPHRRQKNAFHEVEKETRKKNHDTIDDFVAVHQSQTTTTSTDGVMTAHLIRESNRTWNDLQKVNIVLLNRMKKKKKFLKKKQQIENEFLLLRVRNFVWLSNSLSLTRDLSTRLCLFQLKWTKKHCIFMLFITTKYLKHWK